MPEEIISIYIILADSSFWHSAVDMFYITIDGLNLGNIQDDLVYMM